MVHAIILGAGKSERFKTQKLLIEIFGRTVIEHVIDAFENCEIVDTMVLVVSKEIENVVKNLVISRPYRKVEKVLRGGKARRESGYIGLSNLRAEPDDVVLIHDAARPIVSCDLLRRIVEHTKRYGAVVPVVSVPETISLIDEDGSIKEIPPRKRLRRHQTPQSFRFSIIKRAHELALNDPEVDEEITDDAGLVLRYKLSKVYIVEGDVYNIKITYPLDLKIIKEILKEREKG